MKKIAYIAPEMEVVEIASNYTILSTSSNENPPIYDGPGPEDDEEAG